MITLQRGFDITKAHQRPGRVPVVSSGGISSYHDEAPAAGPGVVIGRKGALGKVFYLEGDYWPHDTTLWVKDFHGNDPRFAYYFLKTLDTLRLDVGSANPTLNRNHVHAQPVVWPPLPEQEIIAAILGALDDKIDSNRRLAGLLEEAATTLFRAWFVDFVGVEEFDDSELGPIPRGWQAGSLVDLAKFVNGKAFTRHASGAGRPILRIRELNQGVDRQTLRAELDVDDVYIARADDILFAWSGSLGVYRWPGDEALINQHIFKVIPGGTPQWFVHGWIEEHMDSFRSVAADKATTMGHIQRRHLAEARVAVPSSHAIQDADRVVGAIDQHRAALVQECRTLTKLRDSLLPKLITGEIRVPDASDVAEVIEPLVA